MNYIRISEPDCKALEDGGVSTLTLIQKEGTPPILLVDTTYANEGSSPIDEKTGKHIQRKIEWKAPETGKSYREEVIAFF